jgi:aryl-alcohol dehydrogenase-like predicted oxidoreductase
MKLILGAAQFGLDYGVTNRNGQVATGEINNILPYAKDNGIDILDTAASYGSSEQVLGDVGVDDFQIITKTTSLKDGVDWVIKNFHQSLVNLNKKSIEGLLVHDISEVNDKNFNSLFDAINELKQKGLINKIGFSTYTPEQVDFLLENFDFDLIQLPFNIFDNRLIQGGQLKALKDKNIEVHSRSVFLQGVLLDFNNLPSYFSTWKDQFKEYQEIVEETGMSLLEHSLNFSLNIEEIDKVLVGVNSKNQLKEIIQSICNHKDIKPYPINDVNLLNPSLWRV